MTDAALRNLAAAATVLGYAALCLGIYWRQQQRSLAQARAAAALSSGASAQPTLVLYGSQTGQAEALAWQTASWLHEGDEAVRVLSLNEASKEILQGANRALFIASTYGEGDAPDGASIFVEEVMGQKLDLSALRFSVLALGDSQYANFCGFGRQMDAWLSATGATQERARIDVDNGDADALASWRAQWVGNSVSAQEQTSSVDEPATVWTLVARELVNAGSAGTPVFHVAFTAPPGAPADWESGDLAQVSLASDPSRPRDYSISSIPRDGQLQLLVRQEQHADGTLGAASGLLTSTLAIGDSLALRVRPHRNFRLGDNMNRPLILIGNGTGLAGLRSHLKARAAAGQTANWLVFGERSSKHDFLYRAELDAWRQAGVLQRIDLAFSRDQEERIYVQHRLLKASEEVLAWFERSAAVYVCGSLQGMASGVDASLRQILGEPRMRELTAQGRYKRDVY